MKISFNEVWEFTALQEPINKGWECELVAGVVSVVGVSALQLKLLQNDETYDTELLPEIFTHRGVLWQPVVHGEADNSLPALRIFNAYCVEVANEYQKSFSSTNYIYASLLLGLARCCQWAIHALETGSVPLKSAIGEFRVRAFPIVKFFIMHPSNRPDYRFDAVNRLNFAVKIMLTQFHSKYTDLKEPYWEVSPKTQETTEKSTEKALEESEKS